ncbi:MAG: hypothetical protein WCP21_11455, partial [Armatimonadota bacterium]
IRTIALFTIGVSLLVAAAPAGAVPVFARKYGFSCTMCHSSYPRLNDFGQRYRNNGYQLPGREDDEKTVLEGPMPFAARTSAGYTSDRFKNTAGAENTNQFELGGLDLLSAGLIKQNIGYFMIYVPEISGSRGVAPQTGSLEMANVVFSHLTSLNLNARVGRFEGAWLPFSAKRNLTFSPYEVYALGGPGGLALDETQTGVELSGATGYGLRYAAGWVDGSTTNHTSDSPSDFYVRAAKVFGAGEGQTAGHRVGVFGYFGQARPTDTTLPDTGRHSLNRCGFDGTLNLRQWSVDLQYLRGTDDAALTGGTADYDFSGGFLQATYLPSTKLVALARYDCLNTPDGPGADVKRWTIAGRYYFADNIALHTEYSHRTQDLFGSAQAKEDFFTTRVDWAF